eukprot:GHVH01000125.1.p1 GENE.GHVH01000125.1~~GHVH01000125.1.p1  ORF type:complete len:130 (+),score=24.83 GHVH01000125.1:44-433(+)
MENSFDCSTPELTAVEQEQLRVNKQWSEIKTGAQFHKSQIEEYSPQGDPLILSMYGYKKSKDFIKNPYNPPDFGTDVQVQPVGGQFYVAPPVGMPFMDPFGIFNPASMVPFSALNDLMKREADEQDAWF